MTDKPSVKKTYFVVWEGPKKYETREIEAFSPEEVAEKIVSTVTGYKNSLAIRVDGFPTMGGNFQGYRRKGKGGLTLIEHGPLFFIRDLSLRRKAK